MAFLLVHSSLINSSKLKKSFKGISSKAGIPPPNIDLKGNGNIYAPFHGIANISLGKIDLKKDILISNLAQSNATASAWLPTIELYYQFGQSGVNKFRPYIGAGIMYTYFNDLKVSPGTQADLIQTGI